MNYTYNLGLSMTPRTALNLNAHFDSAPLRPVTFPLLSLGQLAISFPEPQTNALLLKLATEVMLKCTGAANVYDENVMTDFGTAAGSVFCLLFELTPEVKALRQQLYELRSEALVEEDWVPHMLLSEPVGNDPSRRFLRSLSDSLHHEYFAFGAYAMSPHRIHADHLISMHSDMRHG